MLRVLGFEPNIEHGRCNKLVIVVEYGLWVAGVDVVNIEGLMVL